MQTMDKAQLGAWTLINRSSDLQCQMTTLSLCVDNPSHRRSSKVCSIFWSTLITHSIQHLVLWQVQQKVWMVLRCSSDLLRSGGRRSVGRARTACAAQTESRRAADEESDQPYETAELSPERDRDRKPCKCTARGWTGADGRYSPHHTQGG